MWYMLLSYHPASMLCSMTSIAWWRRVNQCRLSNVNQEILIIFVDVLPTPGNITLANLSFWCYRHLWVCLAIGHWSRLPADWYKTMILIMNWYNGNSQEPFFPSIQNVNCQTLSSVLNKCVWNWNWNCINNAVNVVMVDRKSTSLSPSIS